MTTGFEKALSDLGLERQDHLSAPEAEWGEEMATTVVGRLLAAAVTAALVFVDREATLIIRAVGQRGLRVPSDIALVSYDETADLAEVPLTVVVQLRSFRSAGWLLRCCSGASAGAMPAPSTG